MTVYEVVGQSIHPASPHKPRSSKPPQVRKRERETDFEKNARKLAAKKRALQPKSPIKV